MGQEISHQDYAYRVLEVRPNSPAAKAHLQPYIDFILYNPSFNDGVLFSEFLFQYLTIPITLRVYNIVSRVTRDVQIIPMKLDQSSNYLGCTYSFEKYFNAHEKVFKVSDVQIDSPAFKAGLGKIGDFLICTRERTTFDNPSEIHDYLFAKLNQGVDLVIYNVHQHSIRITKITPSDNWGGRGVLGCRLIQENEALDLYTLYYQHSQGKQLQFLTEENSQHLDHQNVSDLKTETVQETISNDHTPILIDDLAEVEVLDSHDCSSPVNATSKEQIPDQDSNPLIPQQELISPRQPQVTEQILPQLSPSSEIHVKLTSYHQRKISQREEKKQQAIIRDTTPFDDMDQTVLFHRSDGKHSEFIFVNT